MANTSKDYEIMELSSKGVRTQDYSACLALIKSGGADRVVPAGMELPLAEALVVARQGSQIVGVGVIKRERPSYATKIAACSGAVFSAITRELGLVAVDPEHRGNHLSDCIVAELLRCYRRPLFAVTSDAFMKKTLQKAGFVKKGKEWKWDNSRLTFWYKA